MCAVVLLCGGLSLSVSVCCVCVSCVCLTMRKIARLGSARASTKVLQFVNGGMRHNLCNFDDFSFCEFRRIWCFVYMQ